MMMRERERERIATENWHGLSITSVDDSSNWLSIFKQILSRIDNPPNSWNLLQNGGFIPHEFNQVWKIHDDNLCKIPLVLKATKHTRRESFDHYLRLLFQRSGNLLRRVEKAHSRGFTFPMRIFVTAERRQLGALRERYFLAEFIDGKNLGKFTREAQKEYKKELANLVLQSHKFGINWHGDINSTNIMVDKSGRLRGIDMCVSSSWINCGKDIVDLENKGLVAPKFTIAATLARWQDRVKDSLKRVMA